MNKALHVKSFDSSKELDKTLSHYVAKALQQEIKKEGHASLILSGGNTPKNFLFLLFQEDISWEDIFITLADERWVNTNSRESNEGMIKDILLQSRAKKANFFSLKQGDLSAHESEKICSNALKDFPFPATVCMLGLGEDGHTASLFPHSKELADIICEKSLTCKACTPLKVPHIRMTLTPKMIGASKKIILHIVGKDKAQVLGKALKEDDVFAMPIRLFLSHPKLEVFVA